MSESIFYANSVRLRSAVIAGYDKAFAVYSGGVFIGHVGRRSERVWDALNLAQRVVGQYDTRANAASGLAQRRAGETGVKPSGHAMSVRTYTPREVAAMVEGAVTTALDRIESMSPDQREDAFTSTKLTLRDEVAAFVATGKIPGSWGVE